jgi:quercetin dioxygenase-like cupin family protein
MAEAGEHLRNSRTGEQLVFSRVAADTSGELLEFDWCFPPRGSVPAHVHRFQEERFEILSGCAWFRVAGRRRQAGGGEQVAVPPRTVHRWGNAGEDDLWARIQFRPALRTEQLFEALFALARDGRVDRKGRPQAPQLAMLLLEFGHELQVPWVPAPVQMRLLKLVAAFGRQREGTPPARSPER